MTGIPQFRQKGVPLLFDPAMLSQLMLNWFRLQKDLTVFSDRLSAFAIFA